MTQILISIGNKMSLIWGFLIPKQNQMCGHKVFIRSLGLSRLGMATKFLKGVYKYLKMTKLGSYWHKIVNRIFILFVFTNDTASNVKGNNVNKKIAKSAILNGHFALWEAE